MASPQDHISMALFCDFENVALGVRDAKYDKFDIKRVLERLLLKGSIVVKKAYCDWERYKGFKATMHEANFELIEIPHVRQSGKNSADIRLVVDALDLCYTKSHVNTFVIISGDSDFSPLVSKLRENAKHVIGVGVKQSTSDLLIANCDEFIFYDDLVRESQRAARRDEARDDSRDAPQQPRRTPEEERQRRETMESRRTKGVNMAAETFEAMVAERGDSRVWASVLKEAIKRRNPGFSEGYFGFKTFGNLLEEAQVRGLLEFGRDDKSGAYVTRGSGVPSAPTPRADNAPVQQEQAARAPASEPLPRRHAFHPSAAPSAEEQEQAHPQPEGNRRGNRGGRNNGGGRPQPSQQQQPSSPASARQMAAEVAAQLMAEEDGPAFMDAEPPLTASEPAPSAETGHATAPRQRQRQGGRRSSGQGRGRDRDNQQPAFEAAAPAAAAQAPSPAPVSPPPQAQPEASASEPAAPKRKAPARKKAATTAESSAPAEAPAPRSRRPASKKAVKPDQG